ncbi:CRISPR-associated helicase Cas3' [Fodinibius saliphilus]|uniref:CRISPR-associated helicase Cas3' n=1 Tax=Fodinibius saliphilus TaxID=1920650 RepID=UPI001107BDAC|nr:CRISPR-associated helicase Cas3' [Fodinibius saliphilus]
MHQTFEKALNKAGFPSGRAKQDKVFNAFRSGKHVILKAPTGWGKTFAVNAALGNGHHIYSLPLRVLVDSLTEATNDFNLHTCVAHHGQERNHPFLDPGNDPVDPYGLVYTTLDQTLSSFLGIPIGVSLRQGNILPAVVDNSHLIFDEFHLFEPERSWTTALFALQQAKKNCVVLTATLSDFMLEFLEEFLATTDIGKEYGVEVIEAGRPFLNRKELVEGNGFENVESIELGQRTIIIKNDINSAKETAQVLRKQVDLPVYLLHSELLAQDRKEIEERVQNIFSEDTNESGILVATQVVEAGIDITCDVMHTDLCPPSSFIQRAGRSARYEGEESKIIWHAIENAGPYRSQEELIEDLEQYLEGKELLDENTEQEIINLSESFDKEQVEKFKQRNVREVDKLRSQRDYSAYRDMIRSIDNKNVAIGTDLSQTYHFISVSRSKFYYKEGFFYKAALEKPSKYGVYNSELGEVVPTDHIEKADFILFDPEFVGYRKELGFTFDQLGGAEKFLDKNRDTVTRYDYDNETYEEHVNRLYLKLSTASWMIDHLADHPWIGTKQNADFIARFLIWAHDLGKLTLKWQQAHQVASDSDPMAHTKKDGEFDRIRKPPKHAWIGAWMVLDYLLKRFGEDPKSPKLTKPVFWAIADHHGYSDNLNKKDIQPYEIGFLEYLDGMAVRNDWIEDEWNSSILDPIRLKKSETENVYKNFRNQALQLRPEDDLSLYFMFCYILRKADQNATELVSIKREEQKTSTNKSMGNIVE